MKEYKVDNILGREVIVSNNRNDKPSLLGKNNTSLCPFCIGNEELIDKEILSVGEPWNVKVITNKYPIVTCEGSEDTGVHYVIVEGQEHKRSIVDFKEEDFFDIFTAYKIVVRKLENMEEIQYIQIFKNHKKEAGISIEHPHSQIVGLSVIPKIVKGGIYAKFEGMKIFNTKYFTLIVPEVQMMDYALRIYSNLKRTSFSEFDNSELEDLSTMFKKTISLMNNLLGDTAMNICYYFCGKPNNQIPFFVDIIPRRGGIAGFELATNMTINTITKEECYRKYKNIASITNRYC